MGGGVCSILLDCMMIGCSVCSVDNNDDVTSDDGCVATESILSLLSISPPRRPPNNRRIESGGGLRLYAFIYSWFFHYNMLSSAIYRVFRGWNNGRPSVHQTIFPFLFSQSMDDAAAISEENQTHRRRIVSELRELYHQQNTLSVDRLREEWSPLWASIAHARIYIYIHLCISVSTWDAAQEVLCGSGYVAACRRIEHVADVYRRMLCDPVCLDSLPHSRRASKTKLVK